MDFDDINPAAVLLAIGGAVLGFYMAGTMGNGIGIKVMAAAMVGVVGYFMANKIMDS